MSSLLRARTGGMAGGMIVGLCSLAGLGILGSAGCSSVAHGQEGAALAASYLPLEVGAVWRYAITRDDGQRGEGVVSVDGFDYGGANDNVVEYRIRQVLLDGT
ncbi:MAG TPA: hypothetical protein VLA79_09955, partial [Polyangia bacterium]|nr:hypothetical protein [Polyangia bacterium]